MNKQETYKYLKDNNITYEATEHKAVFNMEELIDVNLPYLDYDAKNLFVRDDKKKEYYLITIKGDKRIDLKDFRKINNTRPLSFASSEDLQAILKLTPGSVTPLGLLNDNEHKVIFYLDDSFLNEPFIIGCHPNDNTATVWMNPKDLVYLIEKHGNIVRFFKQ